MAKQYNTISGHIVDISNREIYKGVIYVEKGRIVDIISADNVDNVYILPGLVDSHVHVESSMLVPAEFSRLAVRHGTVASVSDPHEIANVLGETGIHFMVDNGKKVPFKFSFGVPSCVPATPFETSGAVIDAQKVAELLSHDEHNYLSEMMNFPGVLQQSPEVMDKIRFALNRNLPVDGHAPGLSGNDLKKYIESGITTDHECSSLEEAEEKIKYGMKIQIREGSAAKSFEDLYSLMEKYPDKIMFCSDDAHPDELLERHIIDLIRRGIEKGLDLFDLIRAASYNPIMHYGLNVGLLRKNDPADMVVVNDIQSFHVQKVFIDGDVVYDGTQVTYQLPEEMPVNRFHARPIKPDDLKIFVKSNQINAIQAIDGQLFTSRNIVQPYIHNGYAESDPSRDLLKILVLNRYQDAPPALGFIQGFGLKRGAIASSIAHDSHNIICVGADDEHMVHAVNEIIQHQGGIVAVDQHDKKILPLNVGGILSTEKGETVAEKYHQVTQMAKKMGCAFHAPFMTLSFMALLVIPELKIGDKGLFDVTRFSYTQLENDG